MSTRAVLLGLSVALLGGCVVGPTYKGPSEETPARWSTPLAGGEADAPPALATWWTNFNDPELDRLAGVAVRSNLTLQVAEEHVREARAEREVVAGGRWPSAGASAGLSKNRYGANSYPPLGRFPGVPLDYDLYNVGFDAGWELDLFGGVRRAVEASTAEVGAAEYARSDVLVSVLAEVARNYIEARAYQQSLAVTRDNITAEQDIVDLTRNRFQNGLSSDLDVEQAVALLAATRSQVPALEAGFAQSAHHLAVLLGDPPGALLESMAGAKPIPLTPPVVPVGLPSDLLRRRPDVQRAERELAASTAQIGVAEADLFPKFSLTGTAGLASISSSNWFEYASRAWSAGLGVQWDLLEGGRLRANVRVQKAREAQALDNYRQAVLVALEDTENALVAYAKEQSRRQSLEQSERASRNALDLATELYRSGLVGFLNVLDSQRSLYDAQEALVESTQAVSLDLVQLYKALGGGWEPAAALTAQAARN